MQSPNDTNDRAVSGRMVVLVILGFLVFVLVLGALLGLLRQSDLENAPTSTPPHTTPLETEDVSRVY